MKSSTVILAVALALSSSSSISGMPHYLELVQDSPSVRAPIHRSKRALRFDQEAYYARDNHLKRNPELKKRKLSYASLNDETVDNHDNLDDHDCGGSPDVDEDKYPIDSYFKISRNATSAHASSSSSTQSYSHKLTVQHTPVPQEESPNYGKYNASKELSESSADLPKVKKPSSHEETSFSQSYSHSSSHVDHTGSRSTGGYHGKATFFSQDGNPGACGKTHQDSDYIVAIQSEMYGSGQFCGKTVVVTRTSTGQSIKCIAADECPGCPSGQSLDLSIGAFNALGTPDEGIFEISWEVMGSN